MHLTDSVFGRLNIILFYRQLQNTAIQCSYNETRRKAQSAP